MTEKLTAPEFVESIMLVKLGSRIAVPEEVSLRGVHRILTDMGFTAPMNTHFRTILTDDFLPPATLDSDGYFIEDDALAARIRRELRQAPYNRQDDMILPLLLTEAQRGDNPDVIGFVPGKIILHVAYHTDYRYVASKVLYYTNFARCITEIIPGFDIYGFGYSVSRHQWQGIMETARAHCSYSVGLAEEINSWLEGKKTGSDPIMSIVCI